MLSVDLPIERSDNVEVMPEVAKGEDTSSVLHMKAGEGEFIPNGNAVPSSEEIEDLYNHHPAEEEQQKEQFCVADVRKRLTDHLKTPRKMFKRDPEDPSGVCIA